MKILQDLSNLVSELQSTTSTNEKVEIIRNHCNDNGELRKIIQYAYNPFYQFHLTSTNCVKHSGLVTYSKKDVDIFSILDDLRNRKVTGNEAISMVNHFISKHEDYRDLIHNIIDKDLKTRTGAKLLNRAIPNLVPEFSVALAVKYEPRFADLDNEVWYASRKLDGVRCVFVINEDGDVKPFSRQGKPFYTLGKIVDELKTLNLRNVVFDGEICIVDENGDEDFQSIMKEIRRKNHTIQNPKFQVFDYLSMVEFNNIYNYEDLQPLNCRLGHLKEVLEGKDLNYVSILPQEQVTSENFAEWNKKASEGGWEGFMIRKNVGYEGKRTKNLLKVKKFHDAEYVVKGIGTGMIRHIVDGKDIEEPMLSQIIIEHKGYEVEVGSGFSMEQRINFYKNPDLIVGKTVTVQYFEETHNQEGGVSLRFPVLKHIYENGRDC
jgi:DNA ligase-1